MEDTTLFSPKAPLVAKTVEPQSPPPVSFAIANGGVVHVLRTLGTGATGDVFLTLDRASGVRFVVKRLHPELTSAIDVARFEREVATMRRLHHPNVMPIVHDGMHENPPYFVMPYRDGYCLTTLIAAGPVEQLLAMRIARDACQGLVEAHRRGVVHRDVKPSNIFIEATGRPVLIDFGIAKDSIGAEADLTALGTVFGTPAYMSPEQCRGEPVTDRTDVYALGITLQEMLLGRNPLRGRSLIETLALQTQRVPARLDVVAPTRVSRELADLVARMLAKSPKNRPQASTCLQVLSSLVKNVTTRRRTGILRRTGSQRRPPLV
jgi:serine/threonine-protein kinase